LIDLVGFALVRSKRLVDAMRVVSKLSQDYDGVHFGCVHALAPITEDQGTLGPIGPLASGLGGGGGVELVLLTHHFWFSFVFEILLYDDTLNCF
jgi:hypothetical protein